MIVLVTGARDYKDRAKIRARLALLPKDALVIHGACHLGGADILADEEAKALGLRVRPFPADWRKHGRAAGPIRNRAMLDATPDLVLAFHPDLARSRGTADCVAEACRRGIPVEVAT